VREVLRAVDVADCDVRETLRN